MTSQSSPRTSARSSTVSRPSAPPSHCISARTTLQRPTASIDCSAVHPKILEPIFANTDRALALLHKFVGTRNMSRLPGRLKDGLLTTIHDLETIRDARVGATGGLRNYDQLSIYYAAATRRLIRTTAA